jgi:ABC-type histidine transport system ATPase subunit
MSDDVAVDIVDLRKTFGRTEALRGISFKVPRGRVFGVIGPKRRRQDDHHAHAARHSSADGR